MRWKPENWWLLAAAIPAGSALAGIFVIGRAVATGTACVGVESAGVATWSIETTRGCVEFWLYRYQALLAGLAAVVVAGLAARSAWRSVQRQIRADDRRAARLHNEALSVAAAALLPTLEAVEAFWRGVSLSIDHAADDGTIHADFVTAGKGDLAFHSEQLEAHALHGTQLTPLKQDQWVRLVAVLKAVLRRSIGLDEGQPISSVQMKTLEAMLTHLDQAYKAFSEDGPDIFHDRRKHNLHYETEAAATHQLLDDVETQLADERA